MKKKLLIGVFTALTVGVLAGGTHNWEVVNAGASLTTIKAGVTGRSAVLRQMIASVSNACTLYFLSGSTKISGDFSLGANGSIYTIDASDTGKGLGLAAAQGEDLKVWFSTDPGTDIMIVTGYDN